MSFNTPLGTFADGRVTLIPVSDGHCGNGDNESVGKTIGEVPSSYEMDDWTGEIGGKVALISEDDDEMVDGDASRAIDCGESVKSIISGSS